MRSSSPPSSRGVSTTETRRALEGATLPGRATAVTTAVAMSGGEGVAVGGPGVRRDQLLEGRVTVGAGELAADAQGDVLVQEQDVDAHREHGISGDDVLLGGTVAVGVRERQVELHADGDHPEHGDRPAGAQVAAELDDGPSHLEVDASHHVHAAAGHHEVEAEVTAELHGRLD